MNIKKIITFIIVCFFTTILYANQIEMYSSVNKTSIALNETLQLTISIKGDSKSLPHFSVPTLKDFNIYGSSQSKSMSIVNGQITNTVSYIYTLSPKKEGEYEIPSFKLDYNGETYETEAIKIIVSKAQTVSSASVQNTQIPKQKQSSQVYNFDTSKAVFVESKVDKKTAYINEKIIYTFSFYTSVNLLSNPSYQAPSFIGFFTGNTIQNNYRTQINGRDYVVTDVSTEIYPQQEGNIKIDKSVIVVSIEDFSKNYDDFFASFFRRSKNVELVTDEINVKVLKVPQNIGMVGNFKMSATVDKKDKKENEPFDLKIIISGDGNIKTIQEPELILSDNLKKYETSEKILKQGDKEIGKEFTTLIMPLSAGEGEIKISAKKYFDVQTKQIKSLPAKNIKVNVLEDLTSTTSSSMANSIDTNKEIYDYNNETNNQNQPNIDLSFFIKAYNFIKKPILWIALGSLLILYVLIRLLIKYVEYKNKDQQKLKNKKAYKKSKKYFQKAKKTKVASEFYEYMYKGLLEYFASVLGQPAEGLTAYKIRKELEQKSVNVDLIKQIEEIIDDCSIVLYSQNTSVNEANLKEFYDKTFDILKQLDI